MCVCVGGGGGVIVFDILFLENNTGRILLDGIFTSVFRYTPHRRERLTLNS